MIYVYSCGSKKGCGYTFEHTTPVRGWKSEVRCPRCSKMAHQNILAQHQRGVIDSQMREYTMWGNNGTRMYAASYLPNQMSDARKIHPGREFKLVNGCFLPVIKNRTDRKKYLKEMSYIEYD